MNVKILIVNSDPDMLLLLRIIFREYTNYHAIYTNNPFEAIELLKHEHFSLVIIEPTIPGFNSISLLASIHEIDKDIPVIIISSGDNFESTARITDNGAFDLLTKPFREERILFSVKNALKFSELRKLNRSYKENLRMVSCHS